MAQTVPAAVQETDLTADRVDAFNQSHLQPSSSQPRDYGSIRAVPPDPEPQLDQGAANPHVDSPSFSHKARLLAPDLLRGLLMVFQSIDHASVSVAAWKHGQASQGENDSEPVYEWLKPGPWTARSLTHLCASGFMFLLGFGVVMFGRSRSKLGWPSSRMAWHFFVRAFVLFLASEVVGGIIFQFKTWLSNMILMALAADYLIAGLTWMLINVSESTLTAVLESWLSPKLSSDSEPLLHSELDSSASTSLAASLSFHFHNAILAILSFVTISWNIWMSSTDGHCQLQNESLPITIMQSKSGYGAWFDFWWYPVSDSGINSGFPPLAWLSFAFIGLLYGRIYISRPWTTYALNIGNAMAGLFFATIFVLTRLLRIGNLSEGCLHMPEHVANPDLNPYLASFRSFFYVIKYPPDVAFLGYTLAFNFFLLAFFGSLPAVFATRIPGLLVFGKCALFFYTTHFVVFMTIGAIDKATFGHPLGYKDPFGKGEAFGTGNVPLFWLSWAIGICIMYPLCYFYGNFKSKKSADSLWRFF